VLLFHEELHTFMIKLTTAAIFLSIAAFAIPAQAGLVGDSIAVNYEYPAVGSVLFPGATSVIASGGTSFDLAGGGAPVVISDATIVVTFPFGISFANNPGKSFDGVHINDASPKIGGVSLASTNIPGFNGSDVTFNNSNIFINFANGFTSLSPGATISLSVATVPEPTSLVLLVLGIASTLVAKKRFAIR
jgi:hypothetical protein